MVKGIIFDFDGTLVDYIRADIFCLKAVHEACRASCPADEFVEIAVEEIMKFHSLVDAHKENPLFMHQFRLKNSLNRCGMPWDQRYLIFYLTRQITPVIVLLN